MSETGRFSDEELVAYLDGEAEFAPIDAIKAALVTDEDLRRRLNSLQFNQQVLVSAMDNISERVSKKSELPGCLVESSVERKTPSVSEFPSKQKTPTNEARFSFEGWQKIAAVALLSLVIGWSARNVTTDNNLNNWHNYVAAYQALYSKETLASVDQTKEKSTEQLQQVTSVLGKKIEMAQLTNVKGLNYKRAQILGYKGQPLIQLAFLSAKGKPVALCIIKTKKNEKSKVTHEVQQGLKAAHWKKGEFEYLLIGSNDADLIKSAAKEFSTNL